jgi:hypothetical protein
MNDLQVNDLVEIDWDKVTDKYIKEYKDIINYDFKNPIHIITYICKIGRYYILDNKFTMNYEYVKKFEASK